MSDIGGRRRSGADQYDAVGFGSRRRFGADQDAAVGLGHMTGSIFRFCRQNPFDLAISFAVVLLGFSTNLWFGAAGVFVATVNVGGCWLLSRR